MEQMDELMLDVGNNMGVNIEDNGTDVKGFKHYVNEISTKVDMDKDKDTHIHSVKEKQDASRREAAAAKRMQELMHQFGLILRQLMRHKWAWPFMQPVDVERLGLHDYYQVIEKPMDFSTVKNRMEAKDGTGYKHVREIYVDVRLVFKNAMKYLDDRTDVHVMAKTLLAKFEEKWLQLLPKVAEEEKRREDEETQARLDIQLAQEFQQKCQLKRKGNLG